MRAPILKAMMFVMSVVLGSGTDYYKLDNVKRIDQDLYKTSDGLYIETQYCYHYTYGEQAILKRDGQSSIGGKIIWANDSTCDVKKIWRK